MLAHPATRIMCCLRRVAVEACLQSPGTLSSKNLTILSKHAAPSYWRTISWQSERMYMHLGLVRCNFSTIRNGGLTDSKIPVPARPSPPVGARCKNSQPLNKINTSSCRLGHKLDPRRCSPQSLWYRQTSHNLVVPGDVVRRYLLVNRSSRWYRIRNVSTFSFQSLSPYEASYEVYLSLPNSILPPMSISILHHVQATGDFFSITE
ncbi:hypothetical protein BDZ97DRAFT_241105 [Flammula alnicola]|nr:hypothetical protein BDZ97DRAFT_241105 [Flammula alnicola]